MTEENWNYLMGGGGAALLTAAGAAAVKWWQPALDYLSTGRKERREADMKHAEDRARAEANIVARLEARIAQLEKEVQSLKEHNYHLQATRREMSRHPTWSLSNRGGMFLFTSPSFKEQILAQSGLMDADVLGQSVDEVFAGNDAAIKAIKTLVKQAAFSSLAQSYAPHVPLVPGGIPWTVSATPIHDDSQMRSGFSLIAILETPESLPMPRFAEVVAAKPTLQ